MTAYIYFCVHEHLHLFCAHTQFVITLSHIAGIRLGVNTRNL